MEIFWEKTQSDYCSEKSYPSEELARENEEGMNVIKMKRVFSRVREFLFGKEEFFVVSKVERKKQRFLVKGRSVFYQRRGFSNRGKEKIFWARSWKVQI